MRAVLVLLALGSATAAEPVATFTLRDHLKRTWQHELVFFPVERNVFGRSGLVLLGPGGKPQIHQWAPGHLAPSGRDSIAFFASVPEFGQSTYRLVQGEPTRDSDLRCSVVEGRTRLENGLTGIVVGGKEAAGGEPIGGIRLRSGRVVGGGGLQSPVGPTSFYLRTVATGPVFAEVRLAYEFPGDAYWRMTIRLLAGEPVILIDEEFRLPEGSAWLLDLGKGWEPDQMFHRDYHACKTVGLGDIPGERVFLLEPWLRWWGERPRGNWASFCRSDGDELLAIACREAGAWVEPGKTAWDTAVAITKSPLQAKLQLRGFRRQWMLAALSKAESVTDKQRVAPLPQQLLIRHGDVPLYRIKDYVLEWDDSGTSHPRLFVTGAELKRFRESFRVGEGALERWRKAAFTVWQMDEPIACFLATGDQEIGRRVADLALGELQKAVDAYVRQERYPTQGTELHVHYNDVSFAVNACDPALAPGGLTPEERRRAKAQLAYLAYTLASPAVCSPERGYHANPNMTTVTRCALGVIACAIPTHPRAREWAALAIGEMKHELEDWCDANGGWLEAPHYMTVSMDAIVSLALALRESGLSDIDWAHHPKLKKTAAWLAKISTPPDPRLAGDRHMPEIGNTYTGERTCLPGWMARIWRDHDPAYARQMQWMWRQHGSPRTLGIGGAYPGVRGFQFLMFDEAIPAEPPPWGSELFPEAGAVLRAHFPGNRETWLHYTQGRMHQHYDYDEGSFILWGKGQPLCEDFGYYGRAPAADHSRVDDGVEEPLGNEGRIEEFATGEGADYLRGERAGWQRQILFVKDDDPLGPNYSVVRDALPAGRKGHWRVWIATDPEPQVAANPVRAAGRFEADLAVFFAEPAKPTITTEQLTRTTGASGFPSRDTTQRCLHVEMAPGQPVAAVLYPVMKDQKTPAFTSLLDGRVVKIESAFGTDYAFLALEPFEFEADGVRFAGKAGAVQIRPRGARLSLPRKGTLAWGGHTIEHTGAEKEAVAKRFPR